MRDWVCAVLSSDSSSTSLGNYLFNRLIKCILSRPICFKGSPVSSATKNSGFKISIVARSNLFYEIDTGSSKLILIYTKSDYQFIIVWLKSFLSYSEFLTEI